MRRAAGLYSRLVGISKLVLPLMAFGLLALVFLTEQVDTFDSRGITFAKADLEELASGLSLRNPQLSGPTSDGGQYFLTAQDVRPTGTSLVELAATTLSGRVEQGNGAVYRMQAKAGVMNRNTDQIVVEGAVHLTSDSGFDARAERVEIDLAQNTLRSDAGVILRQEGQSAEAEQLFISAPDGAGNRVISLRGQVKVRLETIGERDD